MDVNLTDGQQHLISLYAVDFDHEGRVRDRDPRRHHGDGAGYGELLVVRGGAYLEWAVTGHIVIKVINLAGPNAVISGLSSTRGSLTSSKASVALVQQGTVSPLNSVAVGNEASSSGSQYGCRFGTLSSGQLAAPGFARTPGPAGTTWGIRPTTVRFAHQQTAQPRSKHRGRSFHIAPRKANACSTAKPSVLARIIPQSIMRGLLKLNIGVSKNS